MTKLLGEYPLEFGSRRRAEDEKARMHGWNTIRIHKHVSPYGDPPTWTITTEAGTLCRDGHIRKLR